MPRILPPCFRRKQLGRHIRFISLAVVVRTYVRTHIPQVGYLFSSFDMLYVRKKRKHSTALQHSKNNVTDTEQLGRKKIPRPSRVIIFCVIGTPCTGKKKQQKKQQSFSLRLVCRPPVSRPPRHQFGPGKAFFTLCHSEPRRPPRIKPGAHRGRLWPARQCCSDWVPPSVIFSPVAKISTA